MRLLESAKRPLARGRATIPRPGRLVHGRGDLPVHRDRPGHDPGLLPRGRLPGPQVGQGIEAAIPIAILAIGIGKVLPRRSTILENVIIQSIGANSSHVVAGAVFTIPALYMLAGEVPGLDPRRGISP